MMRGYSMDGWDWAWMVALMLFWITLLAGAIYAAVRLGMTHSMSQRDQRSAARRFKSG
jgi:hypothetical protein